MKKSWLITMLFAFIVGICVNYYFNGPSANTAQSASFSLIGKDNQTVNIFDTTDPRIRIVYFGFTRCPDVCPTSLAMLSAALKQLTPSELDNVRPMFITLDPERDSGEDSQKYAHYFHPKIEGFSGSLDSIKTLAQNYGVIFQKTELKESALNYTIDHSSYFYFLKPDGTLLKKVPHTLNPQPLILAIQQLEKENMQ
ncbi:SCO family protein [Vibrio rumoiensis]|uniref:Photosynthetic protein synthase I n=1 Tax=Vibrio rumoiensis 1S-45 TaxID=1188252 RepID=A0A1E5DZX2_9VIBR|nr:SCO family protein [Vibrio rumoiensis]OEF23627.1 photosynthetic protein synthase I [Vibrio rumoiensis 1S-45]